MNNTSKSLFYVFLQNFVNVILPFLTVPFIARTLGPQQNGVYSYTLTIITMINTFFSCGFAIYGTRAIAKATTEEEQERLYLEIQITRTIFLVIGYVSTLFYKGYDVILLAQSLIIITNIFDISWYFQGKCDFKKVAIRNISVKTLGVLFIFLFVRNESDLFIYICLLNGSQLLGNLLLFFETLSIKFQKVSFKCLSNHIRHSFILFLPSLAGLIYSNLDKLMLGNLNDMIGLGNYQQANKLITMIGSIIIIPSTVMLTEISRDISNSQKNNAISKIKNGIDIYMFLVIFIVFLIIINSSDISLFLFGSDYEIVPKLLIILSPVLLFRALGSIFGMWYLIPFERNRAYAVPLIVGAFINSFLNVILIPHLGVMGATLTLTITELIILFVQLLLVKEIFYIEQYKKFFMYLIQIGLVSISINETYNTFISLGVFTNIIVKSLIISIVLLGISIYNKNIIYNLSFTWISNIKKHAIFNK